MNVDVQYACSADALPKEEDFFAWANSVDYSDDANICIRVVDSDESADLNNKFSKKNTPTNVLSFKFDCPPDVTPKILGDIVICATLVDSEAREFLITPHERWAHMTIHGLLHLLGYDHENKQDAKAMELIEAQAMKKLGYSDPYQSKLTLCK